MLIFVGLLLARYALDRRRTEKKAHA